LKAQPLLMRGPLTFASACSLARAWWRAGTLTRPWDGSLHSCPLSWGWGLGVKNVEARSARW